MRYPMVVLFGLATLIIVVVLTAGYALAGGLTAPGQIALALGAAVLAAAILQTLVFRGAASVIRSFYAYAEAARPRNGAVLQILNATVAEMSRELAMLTAGRDYLGDSEAALFWVRRLHDVGAGAFSELIWADDLTEVANLLAADDAILRNDSANPVSRTLVTPLDHLREFRTDSPDSFQAVFSHHESRGISLLWASPESARRVAESRGGTYLTTSISLWGAQYALVRSKTSGQRFRLHLISDATEVSRLAEYMNDVSQVALPISDHALFSDAEEVDPLDRTVWQLLSEKAGVAEPQDLPLAPTLAQEVLTNFIGVHPELGLERTRKSGIRWARRDLVDRSTALITAFDPESAVRIIGDLLGAQKERSTNVANTEAASVLTLGTDPILPERLLVTASNDTVTNSLVQELADAALQHTPASRVVVHILGEETLPQGGSVIEPSHQKRLSISVVTVRPNTLVNIARSAEAARDGVVSAVLQQADLAKVSPFVIRSATPEAMYFGREQEQARVQASLLRNSVAVLGGRMIGKTSFLYRMEKALTKAGFAAHLADCQTVTGWAEFAALAGREWGARVSKDFQAEQVFEMVAQLKKREPHKPLVMMLDEVDRLLEWDQRGNGKESSEALFRAMRSVSQTGRAQFLFSGERTIARRLADPDSPHWNFCQPLFLSQLTEGASRDLLIAPLESLQIDIEDEQEFASEAWKVTSGHPEITQFLGDRLLRLLAEREPRQRGRLGVADLKAVVESFEFRQHYLETYWGQAGNLERLLTVYMVDNVNLPSELYERVRKQKVSVGDGEIDEALRVLELFGVAERAQHGYQLRAGWMPTALSAEGNRVAFVSRLGYALR